MCLQVLQTSTDPLDQTWLNGKEATVNRALDGSTYPSLKLLHSVFGKINYGGLKHNSLYLGLGLPSSGWQSLIETHVLSTTADLSHSIYRVNKGKCILVWEMWVRASITLILLCRCNFKKWEQLFSKCLYWMIMMVGYYRVKCWTESCGERQRERREER